MRMHVVLLITLRHASCGAASVKMTRAITIAIPSLIQLRNDRRGISDHRMLTSIQPINAANQTLFLTTLDQFSLLLAVTINPAQSKPVWKSGSITPPASLSPPSTPNQVSSDLDATHRIHRVGIQRAHETAPDFCRSHLSK